MSATRRLRVLAGITLAALALVSLACSSSEPTPSPTATPEAAAAEFPYTVIDGNGRQVTFEAPPDRIVAIDSAVVEILFAIGEGHRVVGTHEFVSYPPETEGLPKVGDAFTVNIEATVDLKPDLVFIFSDGFLPDLERAELKVLYLKSLGSDFEQTADTIRMWGRITGNVRAAEESAARFESRVAQLRSIVEPVPGALRVFQDVGGLWTPGPDTLVGEVFTLLKLDNVARDVTGYAQMSPEAIVARDPQVIIATDPDSIVDNPAFKDISAVKEGRVFALASDALSIAGPRFVEGIEELARLVYPELFSSSRIGDETFSYKRLAVAAMVGRTGLAREVH